MKKTFVPAEVFPPGEFIKEELEARGWTQRDLADILGRPLQSVNQIIHGKKAVTAETAKELDLAFGTGAEVWMNLEVQWQLYNTPEPDGSIQARAAAVGAG